LFLIFKSHSKEGTKRLALGDITNKLKVSSQNVPIDTINSGYLKAPVEYAYCFVANTDECVNQTDKPESSTNKKSSSKPIKLELHFQQTNLLNKLFRL